MRKTLAALLIVMVTAAACGSDGTDDTAATTTVAVDKNTTTTLVVDDEDVTTTTVEVTETTEVVPEAPEVPAAPVEQPAPPADAGRSPATYDGFNPPAGPSFEDLVGMTPVERVHPDLLVNVRAVPWSSIEMVAGKIRAGVVGNDCTRGHSIHTEKIGVDPGGVTIYRFDVYVGELAGCTPTANGINLAVEGGPAISGYWTAS